MLHSTGCEPLSDIVHGVVSQPVQSTVGSAATYECETGFALEGDARRVCQLDSSWSGEIPMCNGKLVLNATFR